MQAFNVLSLMLYLYHFILAETNVARGEYGYTYNIYTVKI